MKILQKLFNFKNKIVLITGSSGQIGSTITELYLNLDAKVYGIDIKKPKIKHKNFFFIKNNITNEKKTRIKIEKIFKKENKIDIVINNAATSVYTDIKKRNNFELQKVFDVNLKSVINIIKNYLYFYQKKKLKNGNIINIGSIYGFLSPDLYPGVPFSFAAAE